jgi:tagatose 6-phosphate kinase
MILCLGTTPAIQRSMSFAQLAIDNVNRTGDVQQYASGKSINVARVLRTLGYSPLTIGFAGGDSGRFLVEDLKRTLIRCDFVDVKPATRMCITLVDRSVNTATELIEEAGPVEPSAYPLLLAKFRQHLPAAGGVVLSGSLPPGAPLDFYADCVAAANAMGKSVLLDATGEPLRRALAQRPTIVKPNRGELAQTMKLPVDSDAELKSAIRQLIATGPKWAVITGGSKETVASDGSRFWKISTPSVEVVSPIGSGDSFAAGLAAAVSTGQEVPLACRLAAACGSANAMTSLAGHLNKADVDALAERVVVTEF